MIGKTALITGAGSGIGKACVQEFAAAGAKVIAVDRDEIALAKLASGQITTVVADLSDPERFFPDNLAVDILINNAAISSVGNVEANTTDEWAKSFNINVIGMARTSRNALPLLRKSKSAAIVNTCSVAATSGIPVRALYSATKGAVLSLTMAMATDHLKDGVRVNCVNPGTADTPWVQRLLAQAADPAKEKAALEARQPLGRLVSAKEVASAICYLASPLQGSTTGIALPVDGGLQNLRVPK